MKTLLNALEKHGHDLQQIHHPGNYAHWLSSLKTRISGAQQRATLAVNQELVRLYHHIGSEILERQTRQGWGAKVIDRLASDLREAFPEMKGFSSSQPEIHEVFCPAVPKRSNWSAAC